MHTIKPIDKNILNKKIIFKEGKISQSLYRSAIKSNILPNIIVEFARIYGFQIDFQRDIRKNDYFKINLDLGTIIANKENFDNLIKILLHL